MSEVTVEQLASVVGISIERLLEQLGEAGIQKTAASDAISADEKMRLLDHLHKNRNKTVTRATGNPISLKRKTVGEVKLTGSRTTPGSRTANKTVSVEVRKKRPLLRSVEDSSEAGKVAQQAAEIEELKREAETRRRSEEESRQRTEEENRKAETAARLQAEKDQKKNKAEKQKTAEQKPTTTETPAKVEPPTKLPTADSAEADKPKAEADDNVKTATTRRRRLKEVPKKHEERRKDSYERKELSVDSLRTSLRRQSKQKTDAPTIERKHGFEKPTAPVIREVDIPESITVGDLAQKLAVKAGDLIKALMGMSVMATINQSLDQDTAMLVVEELGHKAKMAEPVEHEFEFTPIIQSDAESVSRPPIVTIMGHVDHGKTSLLDYIRRSKVTASEAGGITQHIGAYHVETAKGGITFLDTPGHAAFTAMRARGSQVTDIVVLIVAADDGVMPQTIEAIQHAKAANVPIIVAINKMDKPDADPDRVKHELTQHEIIPEEWGGENMFIPVSAATGAGIDDLLDAVLLQAEVLELTAPAEGPATGTVIEASLDKGRGPVATILIRSGEFKVGNIMVCGTEYGRVRAAFNENGKMIKEAGPSIPVEVLGLSGTPQAGDDMMVMPDERSARDLAEKRRDRMRELKLAGQQAARREDLFAQSREGEVRSVVLLIKADVQGSAEALQETLVKLSTDEVKVNIVAANVGGISESDVNLALASKATIVAFNVRADAVARRQISESGLTVNYYSIIYDVIDDVKKQLSGLLRPEVREEFIGLAEVRDVFKSSRFGAIAGCLVTEGIIRRDQPIRILRDNVVIFEGELESLRRFKEDVKEVKAGTECGIGVRNYNDIKPNDQIEVYERIEINRTIE